MPLEADGLGCSLDGLAGGGGRGWGRSRRRRRQRRLLRGSRSSTSALGGSNESLLRRQVSGPIFEAATHWKNAVLLSQTSVFGTEALWVRENIDALVRHFVDRPDLGSGAFLEKLEQQLAPAPAGAKKLAAEMMWALYLAVVSMGIEHKRTVVTRVWSHLSGILATCRQMRGD